MMVMPATVPPWLIAIVFTNVFASCQKPEGLIPPLYTGILPPFSRELRFSCCPVSAMRTSRAFCRGFHLGRIGR